MIQILTVGLGVAAAAEWVLGEGTELGPKRKV